MAKISALTQPDLPPVNAYDSRSLVEQAAARLEQMITSGELLVGQKLPSEKELATRFRVSRPTIREAIGYLVRTGQIVRRPGIGSFVARQHPIDAGQELESFTDMVKRAGMRPGTRKLVVKHHQKNAKMAALLGVEPDSPLVMVERVRTIDDKPALFSIDYFSESLLRSTVNEQMLWDSLFEFMEKECGVRVARSIAQVSACIGGDKIAKELKIRPSDPLVSLSETFYGADGRVAYHGMAYYRGDILEYKIIRRRKSAINNGVGI